MMKYEEKYLEREGIFVTGATGFIGKYLTSELLKSPSANIYFLVRTNSPDSGKQRLENSLKSCARWQPSYSSRIIPVVGDLSKPYLGLTKPEFKELAEKIDVIYHNGAWVNFIYNYSALKDTNVGGTREVLRLASSKKIKPVHFISSLSVLETKQSDEDDNLQLDNGYAESKWVADQLVQSAKAQGLPTYIYRLGTVIGCSKTGIMDKDNDYFLNLIKGSIELGKAPYLKTQFNLVPVNYVSEAIIHLSKDKKHDIVHIANPVSLSWDNLINHINCLGYPLEKISLEEWETKLKLEKQEGRKNAFHLFDSMPPSEEDFSDIFIDDKQRKIVEELAMNKIVCPAIDKQLLGKYFSYFQKSGFFPLPN